MQLIDKLNLWVTQKNPIPTNSVFCNVSVKTCEMGMKIKPDPAWECLPKWLKDLMKPVWEQLSKLLILLYLIYMKREVKYSGC